MNTEIIKEKLDQAADILNDQDLDAWLTFARETSLTMDPCLDLIVGLDLTWHSAFIVSRSGERIAIVGRYDAENVRNLGAYNQIIGYDQSIKPALQETITRLNPRKIALNYSESDPAADGLTYGMYRYLLDTFAGTPYAERFTSAEKFIAALRGRKSPSEVELIRSAIRVTEKLFDQIGSTLEPGQSEIEIANRMHAMRQELGLDTAWEVEYCPIVNAGPDSPAGHGAPGDYRTKRGQLLHMDFGVKQDGFCSDLQRMWYFLDDGEKGAPDDVRRAWDACWRAIDAAAERLRPGVHGWEIDDIARQSLVTAGYPEYQHALGHHLGRVAHDGATLLGPKWDRYGDTPFGIVEAGNVYTLEPDVMVPGRGTIGLEEDVLVTNNGIEWLSKPQREIWLV